MFTPHSARHTIPHVAMLLGESAETRAEIGAWYGSLLQDQDMIPAMRPPSQRGVMVAAMPNHYAQKPKAKHVRKILLRQVRAMREAVARTGIENVPILGGWEMFAR